MGWGGGWRAITFLGTCTHVMCYVMGFGVVRLMLTCAWGGTSREMFNVPGCPDAKKGRSGHEMLVVVDFSIRTKINMCF